MCDYCGCRAEPEIDHLGHDHGEITWLATVVERRLAAGDADAAHVAFDRLVHELDAHTAEEEAGLFAELRAAGELVEYVERLHAQHIAMADAIADLPADADAWPAAARSVLHDLREHIFTEETDLFPASHLALMSARWHPAPAAAD